MSTKAIYRTAAALSLAVILMPAGGFAVGRRLSTKSESGFGQDNNFASWMLWTGAITTSSGTLVNEMLTCPGEPDGNTTNSCPDGHYRFLFQTLSAPGDATVNFAGIQSLDNPSDSNGLIIFQICSTSTTLELCTPSIPSGLDVAYSTSGTSPNITLSVIFGQGGSFFPQGPVTFGVDEQLTAGAPAPPTPGVTVTGNAGVRLSATAVTFGSQAPGTSSGIASGATNPLQTVRLVNGGLTDLNVSSVSVSGEFSASSDCVSSSPITPGRSCSITAAFAPTESIYTTQSGTITLVDDAPSVTQAIPLSGTTDPSATTLTPATLAFGTQAIGTDGFATTPSDSQAVTVANTSQTDTIQITDVAPDSSNNFCSDIASQPCSTSQSSTCSIGTQLPPGQGAASSCVIEVSATVTSMGPASGSLTVTDTNLTTQQSENHLVALTGSGGTAGLSPTPSNVAFTATQAVGTTSGPQDVAFSVALGLSLPGTEAVNSVAASSGFILDSSSTCAQGSSVNCAANMDFSPVAPGFQLGSEWIAEDVGTGTELVTATGTAAGPGISLSASSVTFPLEKVNTTSSAIGVTVTNSGNLGLTINIIAGSPGFSEADNCGSGLAVGASCVVSITFSPTVGGPMTGSVSIFDNAFGSPQTISLSGEGIALAQYPTLVVDFYGDGEGEPGVFRPSDGTWYVHSNSNGGGNLTQVWGESGDQPVSADYDGDGKSDFAFWRPSNGTWYIIPSSNPKTSMTSLWGSPDDVPVPADYDGDGKTDIAVWRPSTGTWYIIPSSGGANVSKQWGASGDIPVIGDYDGDGRADYAVFRPSNGTWYVLLSSTGKSVSAVWGAAGDVPVEGDYDGDGKTDYAFWQPSTGTWSVILSSTGKTTSQAWGTIGDIPVVGDYNGDGKNDYAVFRPSNGTWYFNYTSGGTSNTQYGETGDVPATHLPSMYRRDEHIADFDGDRKTDIAVFRPSDATWYVIDSSTGKSMSQAFGENGDIIVPGDYDGDGKTDYAIWRASTETWWVKLSSTGKTISQVWGASGDIPVPGDYDGDGKTDYAVFRPSTATWYVIFSSTGTSSHQQWGTTGDIPVPADYDGDGKTDYAIFRPSTATWYVILSSTGTGMHQQWGASGDIPVPGDYEGDTKADYTVFRPSNGTWYTLQSSNGKTVSTPFGTNGDIPVAKDYDGDEKTDVAVFRPSNGTWYILQSSSGKATSTPWGTSTDVPVN